MGLREERPRAKALNRGEWLNLGPRNPTSLVHWGAFSEKNSMGSRLRAMSNVIRNATEAVDHLVSIAIRSGASDIHISVNQPTTQCPDPYLFRMRVHGKLQIIDGSALSGFYKEIVARLKVLAQVSSTEVGVPLDGQMVVKSSEGDIVLRISTVPVQGEEDLVIRIQRSAQTDLSLDYLQMTKEMKSRLRRVIEQKSGMFVLTGPAGSGKTTTIYSIINTIASPEKKIITAEDPVEARLPFVNHTQVSRKASFATLARSFMRQDADVILIGEIRDEESAITATQLAQTGHLVLTTLHTRDSIGTIARLEALNIHPNSIATTLIGALSQRLVPALCNHCKVPDPLDAVRIDRLSKIFAPPSTAKVFKKGPGCAQCMKGHQGRLPIFELFIVDAELSQAIDFKAPKPELLRLARAKGMRTLAEEALFRVYGGHVAIDDVVAYLSGPEYKLG